jgi:uncharacterized membrane protein
MLNRHKRSLRRFRESLEARIYSLAFIVGVIGFGILDQEHNLAQVLFVMGLILLGFLVLLLPDCHLSSIKRFATTLLAPGICLLLAGILLYKTGISPPPFWAR